jgi:hypothetical protein
MTHTPHEAQQAAELAYPDPPDTGLWEHTLVRICREHFIAGWEAKAKSVHVTEAMVSAAINAYGQRGAKHE